MINFVVENFEEDTNLNSSWPKNHHNSWRFTSSPLMNRCLNISHCNGPAITWFDFWNPDFKELFNKVEYSKDLKKYIIPVGVNNDPHNWAGGELSEHENYPSLFEYISENYLNDLISKNAFLLIDSSLEGYHDDWIFDFFHHECDKRGIPPTQIIFVTGNSIVEECYENWFNLNKERYSEKILVVGYSHFEFDSYCNSKNLPDEVNDNKLPPTFDEQVSYKKNNLNKIKLYSSLNKKPRAHRVIWYCLLYLNDMLDKGLVSMNKFNPPYHSPLFDDVSSETFEKIKHTLPSTIDGVGNEEMDTNYYVTRFNVDISLNTWLAVISEAQYDDYQNTVFISEKIFKSIAQSQPFIVLGNKKTLVELKKLGYKTFGDFFDESYDELNDEERFNRILSTLKEIESIEDKLTWFESMKDILVHNKKVMAENTKNILPLGTQKIIKLVLGNNINEVLKKYVK